MRAERVRLVAAAFMVATAVAGMTILGACGGDAADTSNLTDEQRRGLEIAQRSGCASCHGSDFGGSVAPSFQGLAGSTVTLADGSTVIADTAYLTEAIADPAAKIVAGNNGIAMPPNALTPDEIALVVAYIEAVR